MFSIFFICYLRIESVKMKRVESAIEQVFNPQNNTLQLTKSGNIWLSQFCNCNGNYRNALACDTIKAETLRYFISLLEKFPCNLQVESYERKANWFSINIVVSISRPITLTFYFSEENNVFFLERIDNFEKVLSLSPKFVKEKLILHY